MGNKEREAFRQVILKMAKYRLRRVLHTAGYTQQEVREAEIAGEDKMVELIMLKFDEGAINLLSLDLDKGKEKSSEASPPRNAKRTAVPKTKTDDDDPYSNAFDDENGPSAEEESVSESTPEETPEVTDDGNGVENHEVETPRRGRRAKRETESKRDESDISAVEAKLGSILEVVSAMGSLIGEVSEKLDKVLLFVEGSVQFEEVMKLAVARVFKTGFEGGEGQKLKGFSELFEKSKPFIDKRLDRNEDA